jgi:FtsH-binding integral membrane protein
MQAEVAAAQNAHEKEQEKPDIVDNIMDKVPGLENDRDRQKFVIKVYSLIFLMLLVTSVWTASVYKNPGIQKWVFSNMWLYYMSIVGVVLLTCMMVCCYTKFNRFPTNYFMLIGYTLTHSYLIGAICTQYYPEVVVSAAVCTCVMFVGLTIIACCTK